MTNTKIKVLVLTILGSGGIVFTHISRDTHSLWFWIAFVFAAVCACGLFLSGLRMGVGGVGSTSKLITIFALISNIAAVVVLAFIAPFVAPMFGLTATDRWLIVAAFVAFISLCWTIVFLVKGHKKGGIS